MIKNLKLKIEKAKIETDPFPHFVIKNFLDKTIVKKLNKILPDYKDIENKDVIFQSSSETKKTIMPDTKVFKDLLKIRLFKKVNDSLKKIKPIVLKKI
jgi:ectoine hydroxylase-related dioxygenase (phytanoyl-CoA dioxygenase family)